MAGAAGGGGGRRPPPPPPNKAPPPPRGSGGGKRAAESDDPPPGKQNQTRARSEVLRGEKGARRAAPKLNAFGAGVAAPLTPLGRPRRAGPASAPCAALIDRRDRQVGPSRPRSPA